MMDVPSFKIYVFAHKFLRAFEKKRQIILGRLKKWARELSITTVDFKNLITKLETS